MSWGKVRDWSSKRRAGKADPAVVQEAHEAIINEELWNKVQAVNVMKSETPNKPSNLKGEFILTGMLQGAIGLLRAIWVTERCGIWPSKRGLRTDHKYDICLKILLK